MHQIHYTVWAEQPFTAEIYYRDTDPPNWAEYSHNPYLYSPNIEADIGPNQQWNLDVGLADPDQWAMVVAGTGGESPKKPNIHCALAVDGVVVKTNQGPKGALCSIRSLVIASLASRRLRSQVHLLVDAAIARRYLNVSA